MLSYLHGSHTPIYSSPQQRAGAAPDPRDDIHALGVIAYQMLTGKLDGGPGTGATRALKRMGVADDVAELLLRCASEELDDRPSNAGEFRKELASVVPGKQRDVSPPVATPGERPDVSPPVVPAALPQPEGLSPPAQASGLGIGVGETLSGSKSGSPDSPGRSPGMEETALRAEDQPPVKLIVPATPKLEVPPPLVPVRKAGDRHEITLPGGVTMAFAWCPPGTFLMGSPASEKERGDDEQQHEVTLTKGFWMGIYPVTQEQWAAVMGTDPSKFKEDMLPVGKVSWEDTQTFCAALKEKGGVELRLPTEAEWEYAARGSTTTPFYWGNELNGTQANCDGNHPYGTTTAGPYLEKTSKVGSYSAKFPHPWGLCDVHGNVWEWCADWYDADVYCKPDATKDPEFCNNGHMFKVLRGGSWTNNASICRSPSRFRLQPSRRFKRIGFRLAADATAFACEQYTEIGHVLNGATL